VFVRQESLLQARKRHIAEALPFLQRGDNKDKYPYQSVFYDEKTKSKDFKKAFEGKISNEDRSG
jgi:hypothetical protein